MSSQQTGAEDRRGLFSALTRADRLLLLLLAGFLFLQCAVRSHHRLLWADELLGDRLLNESSPLAMLRGWWEGADGGGPLYYVIGRMWVTLAGHSALSLRLFSSLGMGAGIACVWTVARSRFSTVATAWSVALVLLYPWVPRWQEVNGRFYGFFFASAAFAGLCFLYTANRRPERRDLLLTAAAHALLVGGHILGMLYSFGLIAGMVLMDLAARRLRWRLYFSALSGWSVLAVAWHGIYRSTAIAQGTFWTKKPGRSDLLLGFAAFHPVLVKVLLFCCVLALLKLAAQHRLRWLPYDLLRQPIFWLGLSFCVTQGIVFLKSRVGTSVYADRYLLPVLVATTLLLAAALEEMFTFSAWASRPQWTVLAALVLLGPCAWYALHQADYEELYPLKGLDKRLTAQLPEGASVLVSYLPDFTFLSKYDRSRRYYFLLDWPYDLAAAKQKHSDLSGQREMVNWQRADLVPGRIVDCPRVFEENRDLYLMLDPDREAWMRDRILSNPNYAAQNLGTWSEWYPFTLWHVRQIHPAAAPC